MASDALSSPPLPALSLAAVVVLLLAARGGARPPHPLRGVRPLAFDEGYAQIFGSSNLALLRDGRRIRLALVESTGAGFASQDLFLHGFFSAAIKLPADYAAGVVVAFYLSNGDVYEKTHDELDFEFLGNVRGREWRVQTNVYGNGSTHAGREERYDLPFDPTDDFHHLAPNLYKLAWRKGLTVREEIENGTWTRGLWRMSTAAEIAEFILLWEAVTGVQFSEATDEISWKWTANGRYSSKSAYEIQFVGSYSSFNSQAIWKAKAEGKHRFFSWLLVQGKIQTADNLLAKGVECNPVCVLCDQENETAAHLCLHCCFAQEVWWLVHTWSGGLINTPVQGVEVEDWWNYSLQAASAETRGKVAAILIYTVWNIWNERNRRIFQGISQSPTRVLGLLKEEMEVKRQACEGRASI